MGSLIDGRPTSLDRASRLAAAVSPEEYALRSTRCFPTSLSKREARRE
jgi:hypothetical protein